MKFIKESFDPSKFPGYTKEELRWEEIYQMIEDAKGEYSGIGNLLDVEDGYDPYWYPFWYESFVIYDIPGLTDEEKSLLLAKNENRDVWNMKVEKEFGDKSVHVHDVELTKDGKFKVWFMWGANWEEPDETVRIPRGHPKYWPPKDVVRY